VSERPGKEKRTKLSQAESILLHTTPWDVFHDTESDQVTHTLVWFKGRRGTVCFLSMPRKRAKNDFMGQ